MIARKIRILGHDPVAEVMEQVTHAGWPIGTPVFAKGSGNYAHEWHYIVIAGDIRKANDLEQYMFRKP